MNLIPQWDQIRLIGQSRIVGLTMLVPFIGYLILFNDSIWTLFSLSTEVLGTQELNSSATVSRLYFLYFGLTFAGIASLIYQSSCPQSVKEHGNEYSYVSGESALMTSNRYMNLVSPYEESLKEDSPEYKELQSYAARYQRASAATMEFYRSNEDLRSETSELEKSAAVDTLSFHWRHICSEKPIIRLIVCGFYVIGFGLVLWPSLLVFVTVIGRII